MGSRTRAAAPARVLALLLAVTACGSDGSMGPESVLAVTSPTAVTTTEPAVVAEALPTPTALAVVQPTPVPSQVPTVVPTAVVAPTATVAPTPAAEVTQVPAPAATAARTPTSVEQPQSVLVANGAEVYTLNCARCHAENGLGTAEYTATLIGVGSKYSTQGMIGELTNGHPVTFGFADRLTADEIAQVVAYVKAAFP